MRIIIIKISLLVCGLVLRAAETPDLPQAPAVRPVDFQRDIQPIFLKRCAACHGERMQKSGFRVDRREPFMRGGDSGTPPVVAGKSAESRIIQLVSGADSGLVMPPKGDRLSPEQIQLLRWWIDQGAPWPEEVQAPRPRHWAYAKPVRPEMPAIADRQWPINEIDFFVLARLEKEGLKPSAAADRARLIRRVSLDLTGLPPTPDEVESFLADFSAAAFEKVVDRLLASPDYGVRWARPWLDLARYADTQGYEKDNRRSMWPYRDWVVGALNANMPFDQFTIEQLAGDMLPHPTQAQRIATGFHRNTMTNTEGGTDDEEFRHEAIVDRVNTTLSVWMGTTMACAQCHDHKYDPLTTKEYYRLYAILNNTADADRDDESPTLKCFKPGQREQLELLRNRVTDLEKSYTHEILRPEIAAAQKEWELRATASLTNATSSTAPAANSTAKIPEDIRKILEVSPDQRSDTQKSRLAEHYQSIAPGLQVGRQELETARKAERAFADSIPTTSVMEELPKPRETHRLIRGSFLSQGETVEPGVPAVFPALPEGQPINRLALARWLVDTNNPLTARVEANRMWERYFGHGLVETIGDFGVQGDPPTHPELLDWLATEFMRTGWNMKAMHRLIVLSATYRQSSRTTPTLLERDPDNRLHARGPRVRLEAEAIRDQSLAVAGLLSHKLGGPSVMPPQPDGLWQVVYSNDQWSTSPGEDKYRRALYTFWRRTNPYPLMTAFDGPTREYCVLRRSRSNTPLQALNTLNDPAFIAAAQGFARRIAARPGDARERVVYAFHACLSRMPSPQEAQRLVSLFESEYDHFKKDVKAAEKMAASELGPPGSGEKLDELAAWTVVANVLLNLDEAMTKG